LRRFFYAWRRVPRALKALLCLWVDIEVVLCVGQERVWRHPTLNAIVVGIAIGCLCAIAFECVLAFVKRRLRIAHARRNQLQRALTSLEAPVFTAGRQDDASPEW